jgi:hypothetical protein
MTDAEWLECIDPQKMLDFLRGKASERKLRLFACACCRRIWRLFGDDIWAFQHMECANHDRPDLLQDRNADGSSGGCFRTEPGPTGRLEDLFDDSISRIALEAAERWSDGRISPEELQAAGNAALTLERQAEDYHGWAAYRLGDHYSGSEYEESQRSYLTARSASRACASDICQTVREAAQAAVEVIELPGCRFPEKPQTEARVQATLLRCIVGNPFSPLMALDPTSLAWNDGTVGRIAESIYEERAFDRLPVLADALEEAGCTDADILAHCRQPGEHVRGCWVVDLLLGKG